MPPTDPILVLLDFDAWANHRLFDACEPLTDADLDRSFEMGLGSLRPTLAHNVGAMMGWTDVITRASEPRFRPESNERPMSIAEIRTLHDTTAREFRDAVFAGPMDEILTPERNGRSFTFSRGGIATHVLTHSMHHRAQCLNMLRHLGVETQPESSVFQWMLAHPPGA